MTQTDKLKFIQNIVHELLEGEEGDEAFIDELAETKLQLQEIIYIIESNTLCNAVDVRSLDNDEQVHGI